MTVGEFIFFNRIIRYLLPLTRRFIFDVAGIPNIQIDLADVVEQSADRDRFLGIGIKTLDARKLRRAVQYLLIIEMKDVERVFAQAALIRSVIFCGSGRGEKVGTFQPLQQLLRAFPVDILVINLYKFIF